jgi:hypothetical protein
MATVKLREVMRRRRVAISASLAGAALVAGVVAATALPSSASSTAGAPIPAAAVAELRAVVLRTAKLSGDAHPISITAVSTTRAKALLDATPGDIVPGSADQSAYLVVMKGEFKLMFASVPPGARLPTGRYLKLTVNPSTFKVMDLGLSKQAPPIAMRKYGPVSDLTR